MNRTHEAQQLREFVTKIERLEGQKKEISEEISEIYKNMSHEGFDTPAIKEIIRVRKKNRKKRMEQEAIIDHYKSILEDEMAC